MSICLFGATSTRTAIGDGFLSIANNLSHSHDIFVVKGKSDVYDKKEFKLDNSHILELNFNKTKISSYLDIRQWSDIFSFLKRNKVEHIFFYSTAPINIFIVSFFRSSKFSFWCHDPIPHPGEPLSHTLPKEIDLRLMINNSRCTQVFVASAFLKKLLIDRKWVQKDRVSCINFPYMEEIVKHRRDRLPLTLKFDIIFWGRIEFYKGLSVLDRAFALLRKWGVVFSAIIIGKGPIASYFSTEVLNSEHISFKNRYVTNEELSEDICNSRIAVFPYTSATGTQTIQTALAMGCKVVATDVGNFGELLNSTGETLSRLVPPNDPECLALALRDFLDDHSLHGSSCADAVEDYSPKRWAEQIIQTIKGE